MVGREPRSARSFCAWSSTATNLIPSHELTVYENLDLLELWPVGTCKFFLPEPPMAQGHGQEQGRSPIDTRRVRARNRGSKGANAKLCSTQVCGAPGPIRSSLPFCDFLPPQALMMPLRATARDLVVKGLEAVPQSLFTYLRDADSGAAPVAAGIGRWAMRLVRHRPVDVDCASFPIVDEPNVRMINDGSFIARQVFWLGREGYEGAEVAYWEACCRRSSSILELGANIGFFTLHGALAAPDAKYVAVEPHPDSMHSVERNLALNSIRHVTLVERAVVGEKTTEFVELHLPDEEQGPSPTGAYVGGGESISRPSATSLRVGAVEASALFQGVDLVKIDIEGYEHIVLDAVKKMIVESEPAIFVEMRRNTHELRSLILDLASRCNWTVHALGPDALHEIEPDDIAGIVLQDSYDTRDVVLLPPRLHDMIDDLRSVAAAAAAAKSKRARSTHQR